MDIAMSHSSSGTEPEFRTPVPVAARDGLPDVMGPRFRESQKQYKQAKSKSGPTSDPTGVEAVVRGAIREAFGIRNEPSALNGPLAFVTKVEANPSVSGLIAAMAVLIAIESGLWEVAGRLAERIIAGDQHDLFAQRLLFASRECASDLHLGVDTWLADRFCGNPFEEIEIRADGRVNTCCSAWMPASIGSIQEHTPDQYWNSIEAGEIRASILDGDFSYCSRLYCPKIVQRTLQQKTQVTARHQRDIIDKDLIVVEIKPRRVVLSEDRSCNLSCPSCRTHVIQLGHHASVELDEIFNARIAPVLTTAEAIKITGSGDPIGSRHFRHVLRRLTAAPHASRRIQLQTNGVLLNEKTWVDLRLEGHVSTIWVSVDAATKATYELIRRGGSFDRLCRNLLFLGRICAEKRIDLLRLDFVIQALNFREMPQFVEFARSIGADGVHFLMLRNWGTYSPEEYERLNVGSMRHPEYEAFCEILSNLRPPSSSFFVDFGNAEGS
jgi:wyosine [tRNA(Phe)-imidazoG37] synthetase (radical SAM superfamily)